MKTTHHKSQILNLKSQIGFAFLTAAAALLSGCSQGDNFNDVIPKMMNGGQTPVGAAGDVFDPTSSDRRREAIAYLNNHKWGHEAAYMKAYNMLATDPDPQVKAQAMRALGDSGNPEVAAVLVKGLAEPDDYVRQDAAAAAHKITSDKLIDPLIYHMKKDTNTQVRINCTQALDRYATPKVLFALAGALDDKDASVVFWAWDHLTKVTGQNHLPKEPKPWLDWLAQRYPQAATENKGDS